MMTEQQMTLKNDDLQEKWKYCVRVTCFSYREVTKVSEIVKDILNEFVDALRRVINCFADTLKHLANTLVEPFRELVANEHYIDIGIDIEVYPQTYPLYVNNLKVNTKGYPKPITHFARSRC